MSPRFVSSPVDQRRLNQPAHQIGRQTHGERRRIHGPLQPMPATADRLDTFMAVAGYAFAFAVLGYFAFQLLRLAA